MDGEAVFLDDEDTNGSAKLCNVSIKETILFGGSVSAEFISTGAVGTCSESDSSEEDVFEMFELGSNGPPSPNC